MKLLLLTLLVVSAVCDYHSQKSGYEEAPDDGGDAVSSDGGDQQAYNNEPSHDAPKAGGTDDVDGVDTNPIKIKVGGVHTPPIAGIDPVKITGPIVPVFTKPSYGSSNPGYPSNGYKSNDAPNYGGNGGKIRIPGSPDIGGIETPKIKVTVPGIDVPKLPGSPDLSVPNPPVPDVGVKVGYPSSHGGNYPSSNNGYKSDDAPPYQGPGYIKTGGTDGIEGVDIDQIKIKVPGVHTGPVPGVPGVKVQQPDTLTFEKPHKYADARNNEPSGYETANEGAAPPASATGGDDQLGYSNEVRVKFRRN